MTAAHAMRTRRVIGSPPERGPQEERHRRMTAAHAMRTRRVGSHRQVCRAWAAGRTRTTTNECSTRDAHAIVCPITRRHTFFFFYGRVSRVVVRWNHRSSCAWQGHSAGRRSVRTFRWVARVVRSVGDTPRAAVPFGRCWFVRSEPGVRNFARSTTCPAIRLPSPCSAGEDTDAPKRQCQDEQGQATKTNVGEGNEMDGQMSRDRVMSVALVVGVFRGKACVL
jgi:hypothetical protein